MEREPGAGGSGEPTARVALTGLVVGGTVLAALLLRSGGPFVRGSGPLGNDVLTAVLAAAWALAVLVLNGRYRRQVRPNTALDPVRQRLATLVRNGLAVSAAVVPLLMLALHRFHVTVTHPKSRQRRPKVHDWNGGGGGSGGDSGMTLVRVIALALLAVVLIATAVYLWRTMDRSRAPETELAADPGDEQQRLAEAVAMGRRALLRDGEARAAVIACYAAMETSLAASGVARKASDSPQDLLTRATADGLLAGTAGETLATLFREARYSSHPVDDTHRDRAAAALAEIAARLDHDPAAPTRAGAGV